MLPNSCKWRIEMHTIGGGHISRIVETQLEVF